MIRYLLAFALLLPNCSYGMEALSSFLKFIKIESRSDKEISADISQAEKIPNAYERHSRLCELYSEWYDALISRPKYDENAALHLEELHEQHKNSAEEMAKKQGEISALEKQLVKKMDAKKADKDTSIEARDKHCNGMLEEIKKIESLCKELDPEKHKKYHGYLASFTTKKIRSELREQITLLAISENIHGQLTATEQLRDTYAENEKPRSELQTQIEELKTVIKESEAQERARIDRIRKEELISDLKKQAMEITQQIKALGTNKSGFSHKMEEATLVQRRALIYKQDETFATEYETDCANERDLRLECLAIAPNAEAKTALLKHLQGQ